MILSRSAREKMRSKYCPTSSDLEFRNGISKLANPLLPHPMCAAEHHVPELLFRQQHHPHNVMSIYSIQSFMLWATYSAVAATE
jgi:hypothetical protein